MPTDSLLTLKLPEGYAFADLKLRMCADDAIDLDMDLFKLVCTRFCKTRGRWSRRCSPFGTSATWPMAARRTR